MTDRLDIAIQIAEETCPQRRLKLESIKLFSEIIRCRKFHKGDIILADGEICTCLSYIEKGLTRQHYVKHDKDMTEHISCEGGVVFCIDSYFNGTPTHLVIEALESTVIWEMPRDSMEILAETNSDLAYLYRRFMEDSLMLSQIKADILRFESAKDRYTRLLQMFPKIIQRAPLTYVASYLQMSLETLSRVRSSISQ
ncbi:MAG: Crp/Fnr family transcriptional regulator [Bacteroidales bacterium]|nr:Crp/Fnr family transcriptional regulator [Bacteroidales bacterium]MBR3918737.1 Crp/Fnr family transcriptional regulator [Clostridia bacterium]